MSEQCGNRALGRVAVGAFFCFSLALSRPVSAQAEEPPAGAPYSPTPATVLVTKVKHFDNMCWKIAAAGGTFYFETGETGGKTGFSSALDAAGNDWIGNDADKGYNKSPAGGGKHEYRGWPNFGEGNFDHPQRSSGSSTRWVDESGADVAFAGKLEGDHLRLRSSNATYEVEYHFFRSHAAIKVVKADDKYAFLYEGPVGGEQEAAVEKDYYVLADGQARALKAEGLGFLEPEFGNRFPSPFFYFVDADPKDTQVFYVGVKDGAPETAGDEGWRQGTNMVIFSYGRDQDKRAYTGTAAVSVFGFQAKASGHASISSFINARLASPFTDAAGGEVGGGGSGGGGAAGNSTGGGTSQAGSGGSASLGGAPAGGTASGGSSLGGSPGAGSSGASTGGGPTTTGGAGTNGNVAPTSGATLRQDSGCALSTLGRREAGAWWALLVAFLLGWRRRSPRARR